MPVDSKFMQSDSHMFPIGPSFLPSCLRLSSSGMDKPPSLSGIEEIYDVIGDAVESEFTDIALCASKKLRTEVLRLIRLSPLSASRSSQRAVLDNGSSTSNPLPRSATTGKPPLAAVPASSNANVDELFSFPSPSTVQPSPRTVVSSNVAVRGLFHPAGSLVATVASTNAAVDELFRISPQPCGVPTSNSAAQDLFLPTNPPTESRELPLAGRNQEMLLLQSSSAHHAGVADVEPEPSPRIFVSFVPPHFTTEDFKSTFASFGDVKWAKVPLDTWTKAPKQYGFLEFFSIEAAVRAKEALHGTMFHGKRLTIRYAEDSKVDIASTVLFVKGLPRSAQDKDLELQFKPFGPIRCQIDADQNGMCKGSGWVTFRDSASARTALRAVHGSVFPGGGPLDICFSRLVKSHPVL